MTLLNRVLSDKNKRRENYIYLTILLVGIVVSSLKYGFVPSIIVWSSWILIGYIVGRLWS